MAPKHMMQNQIQQSATGQSGMTGWKTADTEGQVRPGQTAVDSGGRPIGTIEAVVGDHLRIAMQQDAGPHRMVPVSRVLSAEGNKVRLNCRAEALPN